jgi:cysteine desulfurase
LSVLYLDHHAATPLCAAARDAMDAARELSWANPSSVHAAGRAARALLEGARRQVAAAIRAAPADVVLTSGGSEACNLGVRGLPALQGGHVVSTEIEHPAVLRALESSLEVGPSAITRLAVPDGVAPSPAQLQQALRPETRLCAMQWVNHETGAVLPIEVYAEVCRAAGVPLFVDATQAAGKLAIDVEALGADLVAIASHKLGGPAGAGALWVRRGLALRSLIAGGGQERGRRAGSPDVVSIVGFGAACEALPARIDAQPRLAALRDRVEAELRRLQAVINGAGGERVGTVTNASFKGWSGAELCAALDIEGVCVASGAACSSGLSEPSPVLLAMYPGAEGWRAGAAIRISFGPETIENTIEIAMDSLRHVVSRATRTAI